MIASNPYALAGVRVVDLTDASGVYATRLLADLGADVLRIDPPDGGPMRKEGPFVSTTPDVESGYYHLFHNMNKRSVVADFDDDRSLEWVKQLIGAADILIESGAPGRLARYALDYHSLRDSNSGLTYVSVSPFGQDGPWSGRSGNDLIAAASGGILGISGAPGAAPIQGNADPSYKMAGLAAASGALVSLHGVRQGAPGVHVDISVQEATVMLGVQSINPCVYSVKGIVPKRRGVFGPIHRCADGKYVAARATPQSLERLKAVAEARGIVAEEGHIPGAEIMKQLARALTVDEVMELVEELDLIGLPVGVFDEIYTHPHFAAIKQFETVRHDGLGLDLVSVRSPVAGMASGAPARPAPMLGEHTDEVIAEVRQLPERSKPSGQGVSVAKPLDGLRVLDFSWVLAGPLGTRILANFGADVIRIESAVRPDLMRSEGDTVNSGGIYNDANLGKRSLTLDLSRPESAALIKRMVEQADIITENFRPGVLDRMGLSYEELKKINPRIIVAHLPGCGNTGPWAKRGTFGGVLMAAAGINEISGFEGDPPYGIACAYPDFTSPYLLVLMVLSALQERARTGKGQELVLNQLSATVALMGAEWMRWGVEGEVHRNANRNVNYAPHGVYRTEGEDEWCAIAVQGEGQWKQFCEHLSLAALTEDKRFIDHAARCANADALDALISEKTRLCDGWHLADALQARGIAAAKVASLDEMLVRDPQLRFRRHYLEFTQPSDPETVLTVDGEAIRFVGAEPVLRRAPMLGEHNEEILSELAGLAEAEIAALIEAGIVR